jgi:SAM-dependent methyltransferase
MSTAASASQTPSRRRRLLSWRFAATRGPALKLSAEQQRRVATVNAAIRGGQYALRRGRCCCGAEAADIVAGIDRYGIELDTVLCHDCATLRFDPYLSDDSLGNFYREHYQSMYARVPDPEAYFLRQGRYGARLLAAMAPRLAPGATVVEVGCGAGGALAAFAAAGFDVEGCDHAAPLIEFGRSKGLQQLAAGDIQALLPRFGSGGKRAALVYLHHVFEHVSDPEVWLQQAKGMLAEDGMIVVAVPDITGSDRYASPGGDLRLALHIAHKYNFTLQGLQTLAGRVGLHASTVAVEHATSAPEMWVAFTRTPSTDAGAAWQGDSDTMWRTLRSIEWGHLRRSLRRRLLRVFKR